MKTRLLAVGLLAALSLTACGDDDARGATAATIGDGAARVSTEDLADYVQQAADDPAAAKVQDDLEAFQRDVLTALVTTDLYEVAAERAGVSISQAQVDEQFAALAEQNGGEQALLEAAAQEGLSRELLLRLQRGRALNLALGEKLTEGIVVDPAQLAASFAEARDAFDRVTVSQVLLPDLASAQALLPQARGLDDAAFQELVRERSTDEQARETGGVLGPLTRSQFTEGGEEAYGTAVFGAAQGDTLVVQGAAGAYVVRVLERDTQTIEEATPRLRQALLQEQISSAVTAAVAEVDVEVNPRFGTWDEALSAVVPTDQQPGTRPLSRRVSLVDAPVTELGAPPVP